MSIFAAENKMRVARILRSTKFDLRGKKQAIWNYFLSNEINNGTSFIRAKPGGQLYIILGHNQQVIKLGNGAAGADDWYAYWHEMYGFGAREDFSKMIYDVLRAHIVTHGEHVELRRMAAFDPVTKTGYVSQYSGRMFKIDGANITTVPNGEDGIFFADDDGGLPCDITPDVGNHGILLDRLTNLSFAPAGLSGITIEQQRQALTIWLFAVAFPDLMPTKPLLMLEGPRGSGKTSTVGLMQLIIQGHQGRTIVRKNKEDDFGVLLLRRPICLLDNVDSYIDWIPDAVAAYTTGGEWTGRKLYTDDDQLTIKPHAFIAVATRNPASFRRDDVADRCIILRMERRKNFTPDSQLHKSIIDNRSALFGEYLWALGQITQRLREQEPQAVENERMADFAALGRVVGQVFNWEPDAVSNLLRAMQGERDAFINEGDPLVDLIGRWLAYKTKHQASNVGRLVSAVQLHAELETLATAYSIEWKDSARTLETKIRSPHIERMFVIEGTTVNSTRHFRMWRHSDPRLEVVPTDDIMRVPT